MHHVMYSSMFNLIGQLCITWWIRVCLIWLVNYASRGGLEYVKSDWSIMLHVTNSSMLNLIGQLCITWWIRVCLTLPNMGGASGAPLLLFYSPFLQLLSDLSEIFWYLVYIIDTSCVKILFSYNATKITWLAF